MFSLKNKQTRRVVNGVAVITTLCICMILLLIPILIDAVQKINVVGIIAPYYTGFMYVSIAPIACCGLVWAIRNKLIKGIPYACRHYRMMLRLRRALLDANYYIPRYYLGREVAELPKIKFSFSKDFQTGSVAIENKVKFDKQLDNARISSALGKYITDMQYLSDDENWYIFEFYDGTVERRMHFGTSDEFEKYSSGFASHVIFIDHLTSFSLHHALIVGQTGSGKTYALYSLILQMVHKSVRYHLFFADPKGSSLAVLGDKVMPENTAVEIEDIVQQLRHFCQKMNERKAVLKEKLKNRIDASYSDFDLEPHVFIFDEFASFQTAIQTLEKKKRDEIHTLLAQIVLQGRQLGFFLWIVMQKSDSTLLPTYLRENLPLKVVLGNAEPQTYVTAFGVGVDVPIRKFGKGEGVFTYPGIANQPKFCAFSTLDFDILQAFQDKERG